MRRASTLSIAILGLCLLAAGCRKDEPPRVQSATKEAVPATAPQTATASKADVKSDSKGEPWGDITGRIVWGGNPNKINPPPLNIAGNTDQAACEKNGPVPDETWVIDPKSKGVRDTFIWLEPVSKDDKIAIHPSLKDLPSPTVEVDQPSCAFIAHAIALREGQTLVVKNSSPITHNFKWSGNPIKNPGGSVIMPPKMTQNIANLVADRLPIAFECNIHPWMRGWARVYDHPYYAVSAADGKFVIKNAPEGLCKLKVWHGSVGWHDGVKGKDGRPITVRSGSNDLGEIVFR